ncbi:rho-related BTB domain-containing protein 2-like [Asterias rubens]|uniref:rho-related BTB domain-containing protein 2-like n=1 Tax=Asterias rubens TaxID=7604 RepID=UPI001455CCFF|nr:rho-related BTB domain-containing protein 2-like [Asterias rubens]XP_033633371.1 rho-related BTB domain-containing protein 2-like [Asterias rubens]XP_033633372.1 rho-related BTB domain-containing protein 2-like [Asterias rubens]XP_033633373.1 rho-related BTB domain-containing protein 2-like [Asterias rubens]
MDNELPRQELVKCVVVGDSSTGKTRLIVARATKSAMTRAQLFQTHKPSVWAIDQYHRCQEVLENSWEVVDGVSVTLRLWDTFGDHEKDRRFAYGRADVVLLLFSVADAVSLRNTARVWLPEIRHFCPRAPIILCGTKNDLRYADLEALLKERGPVSHHCTRHRPFDPKGIVSPKEGRQIAKEINAFYYETSAYTLYGVEEVFDNVVRAALIARRQHRFWQSNLKKVQRPLPQAPYLPPCPIEPRITVPPSTYDKDISSMLRDLTCADVTFVVQGEYIHAHKVSLIAASSVFHDLFMLDLSDQLDSSASQDKESSNKDSHLYGHQHWSSPVSVPQQLMSTSPDIIETPPDNSSHHHQSNCDRDRVLMEDGCMSISPNGNTCVISAPAKETPPAVLPDEEDDRTDFEESMERVDDVNVPTVEATIVPMSLRYLPGKVMNHPAFHSIHLQQAEDLITGRPKLRSVVVLNCKITPDAFRAVLWFLYTGSLNTEKCANLSDVITAASLLDLPDVVSAIANIKHQEEYMNLEIAEAFLDRRRDRFRELFADKGFLSDMVIKLDDGAVITHMSLLMVRCDPMLAMLSRHFKERSHQEVVLIGFKKNTFKAVLVYLYTDQFPDQLTRSEMLSVIEVANFLCLPRLVALAEQRLVQSFQGDATGECDIGESISCLLETCKLHNADQLYHWCVHHMAIHYDDIMKKHPRLLREISQEVCKQIHCQRWPPVYYLQEAEEYEQQQREKKRLADRAKKHKWCLK